LLILDRLRGAALTTAYGTRWLLPMLLGASRVRTGPLALRWAVEHGVSGDVIGQWLGRVTPDGTALDCLIVISADQRTNPAPGTSWMTLRSMTALPPLLEYQQWAIRAATARTELPSVTGPFGTVTWLDEIKEWVATVLGTCDIAVSRPFRAAPHEVV